MVAASLKDRYERAMEDLKEKMKHYNTTRESYEVYLYRDLTYTYTQRISRGMHIIMVKPYSLSISLSHSVLAHSAEEVPEKGH